MDEKIGLIKAIAAEVEPHDAVVPGVDFQPQAVAPQPAVGERVIEPIGKKVIDIPTVGECIEVQVQGHRVELLPLDEA
jgi:hypothetical protein